NVRYRGGENIGAFFFHERSALAFGFGRLVEAFGFFAFADYAANHPAAYADFQVVDSRVMRQGENVDRLDWLRARIYVLLSDRRCSRQDRKSTRLNSSHVSI